MATQSNSTPKNRTNTTPLSNASSAFFHDERNFNTFVGLSTLLLIMLFFVSAFTLPTGNRLLDTLFPKPGSQAAAANITKKIGPIKIGGDADDPAYWIDPSGDPAKSLFFVMDKSGLVAAFDFNGVKLQQVSMGTAINNIDARKGFKLGSQTVDILAANLRDQGKLALWKINPTSRTEPLTLITRDLTISSDSYGFALYRRKSDGTMYVFDKSKSSNPVVQWKLDGSSGTVAISQVRKLDDKSMGVAEGSFADDDAALFYTAEEGVGIHVYNADPDNATKTRLETFAKSDGISGDREGLALFACPNNLNGYVVLSSQGNSQFKVYKREDRGNTTTGRALIHSFTTSEAKGTDGLDVGSAPVGSNFTKGFLIIHNDAPGMDYFMYNWADLQLADTCGGGTAPTATPTTGTGPTATTRPTPTGTATTPTPTSPAGSVVGDINQDGRVNVFDLGLLMGYYDKQVVNTDINSVRSDLNDDDIINVFDLGILASHYGQTGSGVTPTATIGNPTATRTPTPTDKTVPTPTTGGPTATRTPTPTTGGPVPTLPPSTGGIWISGTDLASKPMSGGGWSNVSGAANQSVSSDDITLNNQESPGNVITMAKALVCARANQHCDEVVSILRTLVGKAPSDRTLALGRELGAYVISADLVNLKQRDGSLDSSFRAYITKARTTSLESKTLISTQEERPNNWGTHAGATRAAIAVYLGDTADLARTAQVFKGWLGDRSAYAGFEYGDLSWQCDSSKPVGVNPKGCTRSGHSIDGVLPDDQRRGGGFTYPFPKQNYVYEGLQGAIATAVILQRNGYPDVFNWSDQALLRAYNWLQNEVHYPAEGDDTWQPHLVNYYYGTSLPAPVPATPGKNVGWTDWTHVR